MTQILWVELLFPNMSKNFNLGTISNPFQLSRPGVRFPHIDSCTRIKRQHLFKRTQNPRIIRNSLFTFWLIKSRNFDLQMRYELCFYFYEHLDFSLKLDSCRSSFFSLCWRDIFLSFNWQVGVKFSKFVYTVEYVF